MSVIKKVGIALAGGGTKGGFEIGALGPILNFINNNWPDALVKIVGVSIGAINAIAIAQYGHKWAVDNWKRAKKEMFYKEYPKWMQPFRLLNGERGYMSNKPLKQYLAENFDRDAILKSRFDIEVGAVNLDTATFHLIGPDNPDFMRYVVASTAIPLAVAPERIDGADWVDGGVIDVTPLKGVLDSDFAFIITTSPQDYLNKEIGKERNAIDVAKRAIDLLMEDGFKSDLEKFRDRNRMLELAGVERLGKYRYVPNMLITPKHPLHSGMVFDTKLFKSDIVKGATRAMNLISQNMRRLHELSYNRIIKRDD